MKELNFFELNVEQHRTVKLEGKQIHKGSPDWPQCSWGNHHNFDMRRWSLSQAQSLAAWLGRQRAEVLQLLFVWQGTGKEAQGQPDSAFYSLRAGERFQRFWS